MQDSWSSKFFAWPKLALTIFLGSVVFSLRGTAGEYASAAGSLLLTLSGAYLLLWLYRQIRDWKRSPKRLLSAAIEKATPVEKRILEVVIHRGKRTVELDTGSPIAMHLLEIGLITKATGVPYTVYELAEGVANLCTRKPALLRLTEEEQTAVFAELKRWGKEGLHKRLLSRLSVPITESMTAGGQTSAHWSPM